MLLYEYRHAPPTGEPHLLKVCVGIPTMSIADVEKAIASEYPEDAQNSFLIVKVEYIGPVRSPPGHRPRAAFEREPQTQSPTEL